MIDVINNLDVDYFLLGNHEFDFGSDRLAELMDKSNFVWLGSNVRDSSDGSLFHIVKDTDIFDVKIESGVIRVGIFGVCTEMTPVLSDPGEKVIFENVIDHCNRCVSLLQSEGVNFIIAMTHVDLAHDLLVAAINGIDIVVGGHDHRTVFEPHPTSGALVIKCGQDLDQLGMLDISFSDKNTNDDNNGSNGKDHTIVGKVSFTYDFQMLPVTSAAADPIIDARISYWRSLSGNGQDDESLCCVEDLPLSTLTVDLRQRETAFACLIAEAVKYSYRQNGCQLGIQNGGFIRRDMKYKVGFTFKRSDLEEELPFPRTPVLIRMSGRDIKLALEQMIARAPEPVGSFPHLSDEWTVKYDLSQPSMSRILSIHYQGRSIEMDETFLVAITDFYAAKGGDGVDAFTNRETIASHERTVCDCAIEYFRMKQIVSGRLPQRFQLHSS